MVLAIVAAGLILKRGAPGAGGDAWTRIQRSGVWRVGMDPSFPPFEALDASTGQPAGLDVDLVNAIASRWGVRAEIVGVGFDQLVDAVAAQRVDSAVSALPVFEGRTEEVRFSNPYVEAGVVLAVPRASLILGQADLAGKRVVAEWGSQGDAEARRVQSDVEGGFVLVLKESPDDALSALESGEADAAVIDAISLALYDRDRDALRVAGPPLRSDPYVVVVPARASRLLRKVNSALSDLAADGTLEVIRRRWLGSDAAK